MTKGLNEGVSILNMLGEKKIIAVLTLPEDGRERAVFLTILKGGSKSPLEKSSKLNPNSLF